MDDYYSDNQPELIHCKFCGEDYAATYKACPFCHTAPNGKKVGGSRSGRSSRAGNRVKTNTRGGGYGGARSPLSIVGIILSIILVVAAVIIVIVLVKTTLFHGEEAQPNSSTDISTSQQATDSTAGTPEGDQSAEGLSLIHISTSTPRRAAGGSSMRRRRGFPSLSWSRSEAAGW